MQQSIHYGNSEKIFLIGVLKKIFRKIMLEYEDFHQCLIQFLLDFLLLLLILPIPQSFLLHFDFYSKGWEIFPTDYLLFRKSYQTEEYLS